mmetsp:Transcript_44113/g.86261  ORF Transcript_44113/g.86261 Transcript_44113/m.86261 type:complete len:565 (-) Transcript_44113:202-1896(-)|eukprot:CAMPEP_0175140430 /NCGR_PEP_ID=MMETSP0087-20121206/11494_1 /TAXON_ID=136419 /ORGANISM="Unknown Unknown, Strain D1" /LENGTH=564 /DNA_ID=CAMNT_0016423631 /DNA_START=28 /DNA_END=1722 /DNA_ORIENTATION=-
MKTVAALLCLFSAQAERFEVVVGLPHRDSAGLEQAFWEISDPSSPRYLQFLSIEETAALIGAPDSAVKTATEWLQQLGAEPGSVRLSNLRDTLTAAFDDNNHAGQVGGDLWSSAGLPLQASHPLPFDFVIRRDNTPPTHLHNLRKQSSHAQGLGYDVENQKKAYGIPVSLSATNPNGLQMVWGPGTFGYSLSQLKRFKQSQCPLLNLDKVKFDTQNHGEPGGDNYGEGNLDTQMISAFGLNVTTLVSNTNTSSSTEEGKGFGAALLDFLTELPSRPDLPQVLSLSLGSLSAFSCDWLVKKAVEKGQDASEVEKYLQQQRQVCMFMSQEQAGRINAALQVLGVRGVSVFGSSGDGGSHFSFQEFDDTPIGQVLNSVSCSYQMPVFPTASPYLTSVGGTVWQFPDPDSKPIAWSGSGGGFSWQFKASPHQNTSVSNYLSSTTGLPPAASFNALGRAYPDVSAVSVDGTSQSSPTMAGIFSLLTDMRLSAGLPPLGFLGPRLYKTMEQFPGEAFQDITDGNTKTSCDNGFPAAKGWDPVTGWGRPVWSGIVKHFATDNQLATLVHNV